jgi:hypothetical protein
LSIHVGHSGLLLVAAGAFALLAVTARGPLGLARLCGPRLHATLDIVVALAVAVAPVVPALRPDASGIVVVEVAALAWVRLATLTRYSRTAAGIDATTVLAANTDLTSAPAAPPSDSTGPPGPRAQPSGQPGNASGLPAAGAMVARGLGVWAGRSARRLPEANEKLRVGARQAGRQAARLQRTWRKPPA